jgi:hypothetical protein
VTRVNQLHEPIARPTPKVTTMLRYGFLMTPRGRRNAGLYAVSDYEIFDAGPACTYGSTKLYPSPRLTDYSSVQELIQIPTWSTNSSISSTLNFGTLAHEFDCRKDKTTAEMAFLVFKAANQGAYYVLFILCGISSIVATCLRFPPLIGPSILLALRVISRS